MKPQFEVRAVDPRHVERWAAMRHALWPDESAEEMRVEARRFCDGGQKDLVAVFLAFDAEETPIGFAELNIRPYAEGCVTDRVAFLEGWYVEPAHRGRGVGGALVRACERWAAENGCTEFASDALVDNVESRVAHLALGFEEVEVIRCFRKDVLTREGAPRRPTQKA